jgi:phage terminase large subunit-like protein
MKLTAAQRSATPIKYALEVKAGKVKAGNYIKLAVDRFFSWLDTAAQDGYYLDHAAGMHIIQFFETFLTHTKGDLAGQPIQLSPYQQFTFYNVFGWKDAQGNRRIKTIYEKVGRKNGKTAALAGVGLYCLTFDDEASPEIYVGATKEAQAKILWDQAFDFIFKSYPLRVIGCENTQREIRFKRNMGKFRFLGGDSKTQDGLNPSLAIIDEYHAHKDDSVREVLESAMGARTNPLIYIITTAGFNINSVCRNAENVYKEILRGEKQDNNAFIMIHELDANDNWEDPENWEKANPNLNNSIKLSYLKSEYTKAKNQPSKIPNFKTKHLNLWVDAPSVRVPQEIWEKSADKIKLANFLKYGCAAAFDLSSTTDLSALVLVSNPDGDGVRDILPFFFCPLDTIDKRSAEDKVPYRFWKDLALADYLDFSESDLEAHNFWKLQTLLTATPGNQIDYQNIKSYLSFTNDIFKPNLNLYDPWAATQLVQELTGNGLKMHPFPQTITHFSYPTKEFERMAFAGLLRHGGHPILSWMLSGCVAYMDPNENIRYVKNKSTKRIDGIIATIMGISGTLIQDIKGQSKYNNDKTEIFI